MKHKNILKKSYWLILFCMGIGLRLSAQDCGYLTDDFWVFGYGSGNKTPGIKFTADGPVDASGVVAYDAGNKYCILSGTSFCQDKTFGNTGSFPLFYAWGGSTTGAIFGHNMTSAFVTPVNFYKNAWDGVAACYISSTTYRVFYNSSGGGLRQVDIDPVARTSVSKNGGVVIGSAGIQVIELVAKTGTENEYWLLNIGVGNSKSLSVYTVNTAGVTATSVSTITDVASTAGNLGKSVKLKASADGTKIAFSDEGLPNIVKVYDFDPTTGTISNAASLTIPDGTTGDFAVGLEFSPSGQYLYVGMTKSDNLHQFDLTDNSHAGTIAYTNTISETTRGGDIKLAPDGNIYVLRTNTPYLGVLRNPDSPLVAENYTMDGFQLSTTIGATNCFSTGITQPSITPTFQTPQELQLVEDVVNVLDTEYANGQLFYPIENDVDPNVDGGAPTNISLVSVAFAKPEDSDKLTLTYNAQGGVRVKPKQWYNNYENGEEIYLEYVVSRTLSNMFSWEQTGLIKVVVTATSIPTSTCNTLFADDVWFFGRNSKNPSEATVVIPDNQIQPSGGVYFSKDPTTGEIVAQDYSGLSKVYSIENSITVSGIDAGGSVLFYAGHDRIYNPKHELMEDGTFLGNASCADGMAVCYMGNNQYWLFAVSRDTNLGGLYYYIIDMNANNGLGKLITPADTEIEPASRGISESIELLPKVGKSDEFWLVYNRNYSGRKIAVREITSSGISDVISESAAAYNVRSMHMKANTVYTKLGVCYGTIGTAVQIFDFNPATGALSNSTLVSTLGGEYTYSFAFSANGKFLYQATYTSGNLYQYDLNAGTRYRIPISNSIDCKIGPDGKMYVMRFGNSQYIGVINTPDISASDASFSYTANGIFLAGLNGANLGDSKCFSTPITYPAICPTGENSKPVAVSDTIFFNRTTTAIAYPLQNDNDGDENTQVLFLANISFVDPADAEKASISFDENERTITLTPLSDTSIQLGDTIRVKYVIKDDGIPVALYDESEILFIACERKIYIGRTVSDDTNWSTPANWTDNNPAGADDIAIIRGNDEVDQVVVDGDLSCAILEIEFDRKVIIPANASLHLGIGVKEGDNLTENSIQILSSPTNNGNFKFNGMAPQATVKQCIRTKIDSENPGNTGDAGNTWQMMTIPVEDLPAYPSFVYAWVDYYQPATDRWQRKYDNDLIKRGAGYAVNYRNESTITFKGRLTNEDATYILSSEGNGLNLIGNPYTASIDISNATTDWQMENLYQTLWVWDVDEAQYKAITLGSIIDEEDISLSSMQAFFVEAIEHNEPASLTIPYATTIVDKKKLRSGAVASSNRMVKITLSGAQYKDCVYLREIPEASPSYDDGLDGKKFPSFVAGAPCLYTIEDEGQYNQVSTTDVLRETYLGFTPGEDKSYTFSAEVTGDFHAITLFDLKTGKNYDLLNEDTFTIVALEKTDEARFKILFTSNVSSGIDSMRQEPVKLWISNNSLHIQSNEEIREVRVYSADGIELAYQVENAGFTKLNLPPEIQSKVLIVKLVSANGILTQKIIND